jgi:hypothetical protein
MAKPMPMEAPAYRRLKILQPVTYAREDIEAGRLAMVDDATARRWVAAGIAVETDAAMPLRPQCPACGSIFEIPETPPAGQFWVQCKNSHCSFGWMR